ncbi:MAG: type II toxin-antitoxin system VapC family toxin [Acidobacteria bacterium]|nr:type II toxin-antitoxin system VapC family toxin [Acidobacteriota bacterium]
MKKPTIYIETSVFSYLTAEPSTDIVTAARQAHTRRWWNESRHDYDLYVSEFVVSEAAAGDPLQADRRLAALAGIAEIQLGDTAADLAEILVQQGPLPANAALDALHIAVAVTGGMEYLLTWNFKHLANATMRGQIERRCRLSGLEPPVICTPEELSGA